MPQNTILSIKAPTLGSPSSLDGASTASQPNAGRHRTVTGFKFGRFSESAASYTTLNLPGLVPWEAIVTCRP